jgi:ubiquinone/menaquinone biosynthesis C-methylase UbiE
VETIDDGQAQADAIAAALRLHRGGVGLERWTAGLADWPRSVSEIVVHAADPSRAARILDVSSGRGEPVLRMATLIGPSARIVATDPAPEHLEFVAAQAAKLALAGVSICAAAAEALPFTDESFDIVTCQLGIAFFADPVQGLAEMRRVLRRTGRLVLATWGPREQSSIYISTIGIIGNHVGTSQPDSGVPDPYRYGDPEILAFEMRRAGFSELVERIVIADLIWTGDAVDLWSMIKSTNRTIQRVLNELSNERRVLITAEIIAALTSYRRGNRILLPVAVRLAVAIRQL